MKSTAVAQITFFSTFYYNIDEMSQEFNCLYQLACGKIGWLYTVLLKVEEPTDIK